MKNLASTLCALAVVAAASSAHADGGPFGLGLELGVPTGLSLKYYMGRSSGGSLLAIQGGIGAIESYGDDGLHLHAEVLWHPRALARTPDFTLPFYLGVGGRLLFDDDDYCFRQGNDRVCVDDNDDTHLGVRVPFGILMDFTRQPFDIFLEMSVNIDIIQIDEDDYDDDDLVDLGFVLGGRYYF